jgi:hypothetical protein
MYIILPTRNKEKMLMKRIGIAVLVLITVWNAHGGLLSKPVSMRVGAKTGITLCNYDNNIDDNIGPFGGAGMHFGIGMGADFFGLVALDLEPGFGSTSFARDELLGRHTYSYGNLMFPILLSLKGGMVPVVTPYIGLGFAINLRFSGEEKFEFPNGTGTTAALNGSTLGFILFRFGAEIKLNKWRIAPEFTLNATGSGDENNPPRAEEKNYNISIGVSYSP